MALDFPNSPSLNDTVELGGKTYQWDGVKWRMVYVITPTPPPPTTATPTLTEVSKTDTAITFTVTNNDAESATVYYDFDDEVTSLSEDNVTLATTATSSNIEITGLTAETQYTLYSVASAFNKQFSPQTSLAITTDATPLPQYELLYEQDVATATTQIDITGLSIGKDDGLRLVYTFKNGTSTTSGIRIYPNNLTTDTNYHSQFLQGGGSAISAGRFNQNRITQVNATDSVSGFADIKISNNDRFVCQAQTIYDIGSGSSNIFNTNWNVVGTQTVSSITSLSISAFEANGIKIGSKIALYKVNGGTA